MEIKTTYTRAVVAFNFYPFGFKGKISFLDIRKTTKVFGKIRAVLTEFEEARKVKMNVHNEFIKENPQLTKDQRELRLSEVINEIEEDAKKIVLEISAEDKEAVVKTLEAVEWAEDKKPTAQEIDEFSNFIDDLNKTNE